MEGRSPMKISVCGKGGSGKSTLVTLLAKAAQERGFPVLIVDSDESNSGLYRMLGFKNPPVPLMELVGGKAALKNKMQAPGIFERPDITVEEIPSPYIQSENGLVLVSVGKVLQSFEGCACPMGVLSREFLKKVHLKENCIAFIDMEAGVEHFGRGIDEAVDKIILVVEPSFESVNVAEKIRDLAAGMKKKFAAVLNKIPSEKVAQRLKEELATKGIETIGTIPNDPFVFDACLEGRALNQGEAYHAAVKALVPCLKSPASDFGKVTL
ncbi:MAG: P-loop NTPase [Deltaproteobacteria bacterium]|nr:P-loop NTPase [Deltaproteobacteria bacterium]